jgi:hypothetical protein
MRDANRENHSLTPALPEASLQRSQSLLLLAFGVYQGLVGIGITALCALFFLEKVAFRELTPGNVHPVEAAVLLVLAFAGASQSIAGFFLAMRRIGRPEASIQMQQMVLYSLVALFLVGAGFAIYFTVAVLRSTDMFAGFGVIFGVVAVVVAAVGALIARQAVRILRRVAT